LNLLDDVIAAHAYDLHVDKSIISPRAILKAIAHCETDYGARSYATLHEPAYCYGGLYYKASEDLRHASTLWGCQAHSSYGPWQVLYIVAYELGFRDDPILLREAHTSIDFVIRVLNRRVADRLADERPEDFFDAWNSGNPRDKIIPADYIQKALSFYKATI
jgi:hypothetical protein